MLRNILFDLQLFADGGDGGPAGESAGSSTGVADGNETVEIPSFIPEKARKTYLKAMQKNRSASGETKQEGNRPQDLPAEDPTATKTEEKPSAISFSQLIESDEYKNEREDYLHNVFKNRFKKYDGMEKENAVAKRFLSQMAEQYGVDQNSATFFEDLEKAQSKDSSEKRVRELSEKYDMDDEEARKIAAAEANLIENERQKKAQEFAQQELLKRQEQERLMGQLRQSAEKTKARFPSFDLATEMQNESFRRLVAACQGDTTAAYIATRPEEILQSTAQNAATQASLQVANAIAANQKRPVENGLASAAPSVAEIDFSRMSLKQLRDYAAEQRKLSRK